MEAMEAKVKGCSQIPAQVQGHQNPRNSFAGSEVGLEEFQEKPGSKGRGGSQRAQCRPVRRVKEGWWKVIFKMAICLWE
jgi:hypothetical protein